MNERFYVYSLERQRPIRLMILADGRLRQMTALVTEITADTITLRSPRGKKELTVNKADVLAAELMKVDEE